MDVAGWFHAGKPGGKQPAHSFQVMNVDLMVAEPTWRNCWRMSFIRIGAASPVAQLILLPIEGPLVLLRWLMFKTCKTPVWPPEIEAACQIADNDPYHLPEPTLIGEGYETNKAALDAQVRKGQRERRMK